MTDQTGNPPQRSGSHTGAIVAAALLGPWLAFAAVSSQALGWLVAQIMLAVGLDMPAVAWPIAGVVMAAVTVLPALLLATMPKHEPTREAGRAWTIGAALMCVGTGLRALPGTENEWLLLALALVALVGLIVCRRGLWGYSSWGLLLGFLVLAPFLWAGALGGWLETLAALLAAGALGGLAASALDTRFWAAYDRSTAQRVVLGGLAGGVALTLVAAGAGGNGVQLLLLLVVPPLAFAAAALKRVWPLVAIGMFGPLGFADPDEMSLFLLENDVPYWLGIAAAIALGVALIVGLIYAFGVYKAPKPVGVAAATVAVLGAGVLYAVGGQPGFYGDRLFVVLKDQASLAGLPTTTGLGPGRDERVSAVYRRLVEHAERTQRDLRAELDRWRLSYRPYYLVNAIMVTGGPEVRAWLSLRDDVDRILLDQRLRPLPKPLPTNHGDIKQPPEGPQWNLRMVGAPDAWDAGHTGAGVVVGSSDSGADLDHPALKSGFRGGDDSWYDPWDGTTSPNDSGGHGTHTLATAVGGENVGVAPGAQWISCLNLDRGLGSPSLYLDCLQFMLAPFPIGGDPFSDGRPARAPHILTNSWGCPPIEGCDEPALRPATDALAAAGIAFAAAAGNEGDRCGSIDHPPAPDPASFTVAAVNEERQVTDFSSRGTAGSGKPDISAPGQDVLSAMPGGTYAEQSGTSMATPHVAGVIALLWSAQPELVGDLPATYQRLRDTAMPVSGGQVCGGAADSGAGIVNAARAIGVTTG